jgi:hypothetical protein
MSRDIARHERQNKRVGAKQRGQEVVAEKKGSSILIITTEACDSSASTDPCP